MSENNWNAWQEHWQTYVDAFAQPIQANGLLSRLVTNRTVTGAYAEAWVRSMTKNMLGLKFRVSMGAVIRPLDSNRGLSRVPQCDLVIWDPSEMPAILECGEFALIPFCAARAIIEVKRTGNKKDLSEQLRTRRQLVPDSRSVLGVVIAHPEPLFDGECTPNWLDEDRNEPPMTRLLDTNNTPDRDGVMAFIYFLAQIAGRSRLVASGSA